MTGSEITLMQELLDVLPIIGPAFAAIYWFWNRFNDIKENDNRLHTENMKAIESLKGELKVMQENVRARAKEVDQIGMQVSKLEESMSRDHKDQLEKFVRVDDKVSSLSHDANRQLSDAIIHLEHINQNLRDKR